MPNNSFRQIVRRKIDKSVETQKEIGKRIQFVEKAQQIHKSLSLELS